MFKLKKNKKEEPKKTKKTRKEKNLFDEWAKRNRCLALSVSELKDKDWYDEFIGFVKKSGDAKVFLTLKNESLIREFVEHASERSLARIDGVQEEITKCETVINYATDIEDDIIRFGKDVKKLAKKFKKEHFENVKKLLVGYSETERFDEKDLEILNVKPVGFFNILFHGFHMWRARRFLRKFVNRYLDNNVSKRAYQIFFRHYGKDLGYVLSLRISTITLFDDATTKIWTKKKDKMIEKNEKIIKKMMETIAKENKMMDKIKMAHETSELLKEEEKIVLEFVENKLDDRLK
jgi:hypothetical protein